LTTAQTDQIIKVTCAQTAQTDQIIKVTCAQNIIKSVWAHDSKDVFQYVC